MSVDDASPSSIWHDVDLVCLAVPVPRAARALDVARRAAAAGRSACCVLTKGLVAPDGELPERATCSSALGERPVALPRRAGARRRGGRSGGAALVVATPDRLRARLLASCFAACRRRLRARATTSSASQLAGCAKNAAALAAGRARGRVERRGRRRRAGSTRECYALATRCGAATQSFAGSAGAGDLVATVLAAHSRNRRAGELLARASSPQTIEQSSARSPEALDAASRCSRGRCDEAGIEAPATARARGADRGPHREPPSDWLAEPRRPPRRRLASGLSGPPGDAAPCAEYALNVVERAGPRQGRARPRVLGLLPRASARHLQLHVLPHRQPPRRRGPHDADLHPGLPALRARAARVERAAAAALADPHRAQPRRQLLPGPLAQADLDARGRETIGEPHDTEELVERQGRGRCGARGRASLPDDRREALIMRFALGMDNREIARALGRTEGATKVLIHRAIKQLEQEMEAERREERDERGSRRRRGDGRGVGDRCGCWRPRSPRSSRRPGSATSSRCASPRSGGRARGARGAVRLGDRRDARPAQLGPPGGRGGGRHGGGRGAVVLRMRRAGASARGCAASPSRAARGLLDASRRTRRLRELR